MKGRQTLIIIIIILLAALIFALLKWFAYSNGMAGLIHYMETNNVRPPNDNEIKESVKWAARKRVDDVLKKHD